MKFSATLCGNKAKYAHFSDCFKANNLPEFCQNYGTAHESVKNSIHWACLKEYHTYFQERFDSLKVLFDKRQGLVFYYLLQIIFHCCSGYYYDIPKGRWSLPPSPPFEEIKATKFPEGDEDMWFTDAPDLSILPFQFCWHLAIGYSSLGRVIWSIPC